MRRHLVSLGYAIGILVAVTALVWVATHASIHPPVQVVVPIGG